MRTFIPLISLIPSVVVGAQVRSFLDFSMCFRSAYTVFAGALAEASSNR